MVLAVFGLILLVLVMAFGFYTWRVLRPPVKEPQTIGTPPSMEESAVRQVVENFGQVMKQVPLSGSREVAVQAMDEHYRGYVSAGLLSRWKSDPSTALGRLTSSPWPERIEIERIERQAGTRFAVFGEVVMFTSSALAGNGEAGRDKIEIRVEDVGDETWLISEVSVQASQTPVAWEVFDRPGDFQMRYPRDFEFASGEAYGGANLDESLARIRLPNGLFNSAGTNYLESYLVVSRSVKPEIVHTCMTYGDLSQQLQTRDLRSNGIVFKVATTTEAAAGNIYESELYRVTYQSRCYEMAIVVHTGQAANYDPPVAEFERAIAVEPLREIVRTFVFPLQ